MQLDYGNRINSGFLLFLAPATLLTAIMLGEALAPGYSVHTNPISYMGIIPETANLSNASIFY
jgi:hypothetical protein